VAPRHSAGPRRASRHGAGARRSAPPKTAETRLGDPPGARRIFAGAPPALAAALGAALMLITRTQEPRLVYDEVDWGLLVFFVGLFLIVGGAENAGLGERLFVASRSLNFQNSAVLTVMVAALSNLLSNVPTVMVLKSLVPHFSNPHAGWLVLAMSSTLAGNLTVTGSVANIIVIERARSEVEVRFTDYLRVGVPITLLTLLFGWLWPTWLR
jgi:Na+/H+ antiporter NhaD/arsenite permease-like protein